jgi:hypothetical protein
MQSIFGVRAGIFIPTVARTREMLNTNNALRLLYLQKKLMRIGATGNKRFSL